MANGEAILAGAHTALVSGVAAAAVIDTGDRLSEAAGSTAEPDWHHPNFLVTSAAFLAGTGVIGAWLHERSPRLQTTFEVAALGAAALYRLRGQGRIDEAAAANTAPETEAADQLPHAA